MARTPKKRSAKKSVAKTAKKSAAKKTAAKKTTAKAAPSSAQGAPAAQGTAGGAGASGAGYRAKVRMYRQGLGDCFLITLPRVGGGEFYVMIDCGVVLGTPNPQALMQPVMDSIVKQTGKKVDILVATHEHWDHLSGFVQAKGSFDQLDVGEVWLAWTEDQKDELTRKLKAEKGQALAALRVGLSQLQLSGDAERAAELDGILGFFGAAKGQTTQDALTNVRAKANAPKQPRYCHPTDDPVVPAGTTARFYVLGPPHDEKMLRKINPSASNKETYGLALDSFQMFLDGAGSALGDTDTGRPFDQQYEIPFAYAKASPELEFFRQHYWQPGGNAPDNWRRIDADWLGGASDLALQLDSLTNNTSLVLAIELAPGGDVLLFAADAQVGNWLSWQNLKWTIDGRTVTGPDLLARAIFYKVGHHGSHNATLKDQGLEQMKNLRVAMIPVDHAMAVKKRWGKMPLDELVAALKERAKGAVLRVDQPMPATQEKVVEDKLYFELTL